MQSLTLGFLQLKWTEQKIGQCASLLLHPSGKHSWHLTTDTKLTKVYFHLKSWNEVFFMTMPACSLRYITAICQLCNAYCVFYGSCLAWNCTQRYFRKSVLRIIRHSYVCDPCLRQTLEKLDRKFNDRSRIEQKISTQFPCAYHPFFSHAIYIAHTRRLLRRLGCMSLTVCVCSVLFPSNLWISQ